MTSPNKEHQRVRPFSSVEEMEDAIIERHNAVVGPKDEVYDLHECRFEAFSEV